MGVYQGVGVDTHAGRKRVLIQPHLGNPAVCPDNLTHVPDSARRLDQNDYLQASTDQSLGPLHLAQELGNLGYLSGGFHTGQHDPGQPWTRRCLDVGKGKGPVHPDKNLGSAPGRQGYTIAQHGPGLRFASAGHSLGQVQGYRICLVTPAIGRGRAVGYRYQQIGPANQRGHQLPPDVAWPGPAADSSARVRATASSLPRSL